MTDFFSRHVGLTEKQIQALVPEQEVHHWTTEGCQVLHVLGKPYAEGGQWKAWAGHDKSSLLITVRRIQFHLPKDCRP